MTDDAPLTIQPDEVVPKLGPDAPSTVAEQAPNGDSVTAVEKRRGGAPKGNTNHAGKSLDKKAAMLLARAMKGKAKDKRTARRKGYENEARGIAEELRLAESYPMTSKRLQRALTDTAQEIDVCQALCENRGRYEAKTGKLKPWYETVLRLRERDLSIIQKAIDDLRALPAAKGAEIFAGKIEFIMQPAPAIAIGGVPELSPCAVCGHVPGTAAQAPAGAVLNVEPPADTSVDETTAERRVPRPTGELVSVPALPVVVERKVHRGFRGFNKDEVRDEPSGPTSFNW